MTKKTKTKSKKKTQGKRKIPKKPHNWDKAVSVAYLRLIGATQEQASISAKIAESTIYDWERSAWWKDAQFEANQRWLSEVDSATRHALLRNVVQATDIKERGNMARYIADRRIPEFKPPKNQTEVSGPNGGPISWVDLVKLATDDTK